MKHPIHAPYDPRLDHHNYGNSYHPSMSACYITITYHAPPFTSTFCPYSTIHPSSLPYIHLIPFQSVLHLGPCRYLSYLSCLITHTTHTSPTPAPDWPFLALSNHDVSSDDRHTVPTSWILQLHFDTQGIENERRKK
jgi:hypothetical protein